MAAGQASDFKIYQEYLKSRVSETLTQNGALFNAASNGTIVLTSAQKPGQYEYESFFKNIGGLITRRDTTSVSAATALPMTQDEFIRVKLNRKIGPVDQTRDSFRKIFGRFDAAEFSGLLGVQIANGMQLGMLNDSLLALRAALAAQASVLSKVGTSPVTTMTTPGLVDGLAKFGDRGDRVSCWVMHSKVYYDLVKQQIAANITNVSNFNVATGTPVTLNRPVVVSDSESLVIRASSPASAITGYYTLGLTSNAVLAEETETEDVVLMDITGLEQLVTRLQGEFAFNVGVKGFKWDVANGGANPSNTALGTGSNWDPAVTNFKDYAGVIIQSL